MFLLFAVTIRTIDSFAVKLLISFADALPFRLVHRSKISERSLCDILELVVSLRSGLELASKRFEEIGHLDTVPDTLRYVLFDSLAGRNSDC